MNKINKHYISIIIPVYNVEQYLAECLNSIINQSYTDYEIILINDGSTDMSGKICDAFSKTYANIITIHQNNVGVGAARNVGIENAKGDYLYFLDSDDYISNNFFEKVTEYLDENPDILQFGYCQVNLSGKVKGKRIPRFNNIRNLKLERNRLIEIFQVGIGNELWTKLFKKEVILTNKILFDNKRRGQDITFIVKVLEKANTLLAIEETLINYRMVMGTRKKYDSDIIKNHIENFSYITNLFRNNCHEESVRKYIVALFSTWFFVSIPINISANNKSSNKTLIDEIFHCQSVIEFIQKEKSNFNTFQKIMGNIILHKNYLMYRFLGDFLYRIRKFKYS